MSLMIGASSLGAVESHMIFYPGAETFVADHYMNDVSYGNRLVVQSLPFGVLSESLTVLFPENRGWHFQDALESSDAYYEALKGSMVFLGEGDERQEVVFLGKLGDQLLYRKGSQVLVDPPGALHVPLVAKTALLPQLEIMSSMKAIRPKDTFLTYLNRRLSSEVRYVLSLDPNSDMMQLAAYLMVDNQTRRQFKNMTVGVQSRSNLTGASTEHQDQVRSQSTAAQENIRYQLPNVFTIETGVSQLPVFDVSPFRYERGYEVRFPISLQSLPNRAVDIILNMDNDSGFDWMSGKYQLYEGSRFLSDGQLPVLYRDQSLSLAIGRARSLMARYRVLKNEMGKQGRFQECEIRLKNHQSEPKKVTVYQQLPQRVKLTSRTHKWESVSDHEVAFQVVVPADSEEVISFVMTMKREKQGR